MDTVKEPTTQARNIETGVTLTKEIALAIQKAILEEKSYYFREDKTLRLDIENEDGTTRRMVFSSGTYDTWIARDKVIPESNKTLRALVNETREKVRRDKEEAERKEQIRMAKDTLNALLKLPIEYTSVDREMKRDQEGKMREVKRYTRKDISAPLVAGKVKGLMFALERLEPEHFARKDETKNTHIVGVFSLADLRQKSQEQE